MQIQTNRQLIEHALAELALAPSLAAAAVQRVIDYLNHHGHHIPTKKVKATLDDLAAEDRDDNDDQLGLLG
jgi:hypothetical protein